MIVYFACCKSEKEAVAVQSRLVDACPTLIHTRVLRRPADFDLYNTEMLRSSDEQTAPGAFAFPDAQLSTTWPARAIFGWFALVAAALIVGAVLAARIISTQLGRYGGHDTTVGLVAGLLMLIVACGFVIARASTQLTPSQRMAWRAARALRRGRPVLIAASDAPPEWPLPREIHYFLRRAS